MCRPGASPHDERPKIPNVGHGTGPETCHEIGGVAMTQKEDLHALVQREIERLFDGHNRVTEVSVTWGRDPFTDSGYITVHVERTGPVPSVPMAR